MNETTQQQPIHQAPLQKTVFEVEKDVFVPQRMAPKELSGTLSEHQKSQHLGSVREAVKTFMPTAYDTIDMKRVVIDEERRKYKLHHARGTQLTENNVPVLKIDVAGSGFKSFRSEHLGLKGKGRVRLDNLEDQTSEGYSLKEEEKKLKKELEVSWYNRSKFLNWIGLTKTEAQINSINAEIREQNSLIQDRIDAIKERLRSSLGDPTVIAGETMEHVRTRVSAKKTKITMAGPLSVGGALNAGDYKIENLRRYMLTLGSDYLKSVFTKPQFAASPHDVSIIIKGHSRGGVACAEGAMMIKQWVADNYPQYLDLVKFEVTQYDPVPGLGSKWGVNDEFDHNGTETITTSNGDKMMPLGASAETTVFYSMDTEHIAAFTPQLVKGAKRVILTPSKHGISLGDIEATTKRNADGTQSRELHRPGFTDAETGDVFRSSGISELGAGLYMLDETNTLVRFNDEQTALAAYEMIIKDTSFTQKRRHDVIRDVIRSYFQTNQSSGNAQPDGSAPSGSNA